MPANLTPDYKAAEERYKAARDDDERLECLIEMLSLVPKHKGTEKIQADIKTRISHLRKETGSKHGGAKRSNWYQVLRQGAGQVTLFGPPNSGKSSIVASLTGAHTTVGPYPFATTVPQAGMMPFEDIKIQLIDTPPIYGDTEPWVYNFLRTADLLLMVLDLSDDDIIVSTENLLTCLKQKNISLQSPKSQIPNPKSGALEPATDPESPVATHLRPAIVVGCKSDAPGATDRQAIASEIIGPDFPILPVSTVTHVGLEDLRVALFQHLHVIRVYTKRPSHPADMHDPVVLPEGSKVIDAAQHLHKDFTAQLKYAKLWDGDKINGLMVERTHVLKDRSIVEYHI